MSIWVSYDVLAFDGDDLPRGGEVRSYASGFSNHYPTTDGLVERPSSVDIAHIPSWCVPGHHDENDPLSVGGWLRLNISTWQHHRHDPAEVIDEVHAGVVLDRAAVVLLHAQLGEWLDRPQLEPGRHV